MHGQRLSVCRRRADRERRCPADAATTPELSRRFAQGRGGYAYAIAGAGTFNGEEVSTGDAAKIYGPETMTVAAGNAMELIVVDVPAPFPTRGGMGTTVTYQRKPAAPPSAVSYDVN